MDAAKKTLELIEAHPYTRKLREEREAETLQVRTAAAERLARSKEEAARILPELQAAEDTARESVREHDKQRKNLEGAVARAATARAEERHSIEREAAAAERILLENYSEKIDEATTFFRERFETLRLKTPDSDRRKEGTNIFTERKIFSVYSNYGAITAALRYIRAAILELEAMKFFPAPDFARIDELRRGIPDTNKMQEFTSEKPFPRDPPTEIEKIRMTEGTTDYLLKKLHEKFDKWKTKSPKASAGKREAPAIPGPAPKSATLETYKRQDRAALALEIRGDAPPDFFGAFKYGDGSKR